jgi:hypothetical protein
MRTKRAVLATCAAACACAGGPALAAAVGEKPANRIPAGETAPLTRTFTTAITTIVTTATQTTAAQTTTTRTDTSRTPKTVPVPKLSVCLRSARAVLARALGVRVAAVRRTQRAGSNGMPQCNYLVHRAHTVGPRTRAVVVINVDNGPQAAWRLMRKVVEAAQIFGVPPPGWKAPIGLNGLGPYASWFPNLDQLMANNVNRRYIFTVSIVWWRATRAEMISLARAAVVPYRRVRRFAA